MPRVRVQARDLRVGDVLVGSGRHVTHAPSRGVRTPAGKVDLGVDGYRRTWGRYTEVTVAREEGLTPSEQ